MAEKGNFAAWIGIVITGFFRCSSRKMIEGEQAEMTNANKEVAQRWLAATGRGDIAGFRELMTADAVWELMGTSVLAVKRNLDEVAELAGQLFSATKDGLTFDVHAVTAEDDRVAIEFSGSAELVNGARYDNVYHLLFYFRGGRICRVREYSDSKTIDAAVGPLLAGAES
jgi:ketosteroid isomerase-like protein